MAKPAYIAHTVTCARRDLNSEPMEITDSDSFASQTESLDLDGDESSSTVYSQCEQDVFTDTDAVAKELALIGAPLPVEELPDAPPAEPEGPVYAPEELEEFEPPKRATTRFILGTWNNPTKTLADFVSHAATHPKHRYIIAQLEKGENGVLHVQFYWELGGPVTYSVLNKWWDPAHPCHFTKVKYGARDRAKCRNYCRKARTRVEGPIENGDFAAGVTQGQRSDLDSMARMVLAGKTDLELTAVNPSTYLRYVSHWKKMRSICKPSQHDVRKVVLLYGPPRSGKTQWILNQHEADLVHFKPKAGNWVDGWAQEQHKVFVLDDFAGRSSGMRLDEVLDLLDKYPTQQPIKGGFVWCHPQIIYVTTNLHPLTWYEWVDPDGKLPDRTVLRDALFERFSDVYFFDRLCNNRGVKRRAHFLNDPSGPDWSLGAKFYKLNYDEMEAFFYDQAWHPYILRIGDDPAAFGWSRSSQ